MTSMSHQAVYQNNADVEAVYCASISHHQRVDGYNMQLSNKRGLGLIANVRHMHFVVDREIMLVAGLLA